MNELIAVAPLLAAFWERLGNALIDSIPVLLGLVAAFIALRREALKVSDRVEVVHKATNSLVTQLVEKTDQESFARGAKSETDKDQDREKPPPLPGPTAAEQFRQDSDRGYG